MGAGFCDAAIQLPQRSDVVENPKSPAVSAGYQIISLNFQIPYRGCRHVEAQRLPIVAIVERYEYFSFRAGEEQTFALWILANHIDRCPVRYSAHNFFPSFAPVVRPINVGMQLVEAECVDRRVRGLRVEMAGIDDGDLGPGNELRRRDVIPLRSAIRGDPDQTVVRSGPDAIDVQRRWRDCINDTAISRLGRSVIRILPDTPRGRPGLPRQIGTDLFPVLSAITCLPKRVGCEVENVRIHRRKNNRLSADRAVIVAAKRSGGNI